LIIKKSLDLKILLQKCQVSWQLCTRPATVWDHYC